MKIGVLQFKDYAAKKPLALSPAGEYITAKEIASAPSLGLGSLFTLDNKQQLDLTLKRLSLEPEFKLGIIGVGVLTKSEVIEHVKRQTEFGKLAVQAEMAYCNELMSLLSAKRLPVWPIIPRPRIPKIPDFRRVKKCFIVKLKTRAVFCENTTDGVTTPFANYRIANVHPVFQARGYTVTALTGVNDIRTNFVPVAKNRLTVYLSGVGHGGYTVYTGHAGNHILEVGFYDTHEVKGKAIHFLSCQTAKMLGHDTVAHGSRCYAGYIENFVLQWDDSSTPINEFTLFPKADSTFDLMMANGATAQQAYDATIQAFNAAISQVPGTVAATYLTLDRDRLRLHGDPATKILPYRFSKICFPLSVEQEDALGKIGEVEA